LSNWSEPQEPAMAMGELGQRVRGRRMDRGIDPVLVVCRELRQLQQNLWVAWRRHRFHGVDVALERCDPHRCRARRRDGAPERSRYDGRAAEAARLARRHNGRHCGSRAGLARDCALAPAEKDLNAAAALTASHAWSRKAWSPKAWAWSRKAWS